MAHPPAVRVNRAPVLTLRASIIEERRGHDPDTALSLGSAVAGTAAHAKARRLGPEEHRDEGDSGKRKPGTARARPTERFLGREIPVTNGKDGVGERRTLLLGENHLAWSGETSEATYRWAALTALVDDRDRLYLVVYGASAIWLKAAALGVGQDAVVTFVRARMSRTRQPLLFHAGT